MRDFTEGKTGAKIWVCARNVREGRERGRGWRVACVPVCGGASNPLYVGGLIAPLFCASHPAIWRGDSRVLPHKPERFGGKSQKNLKIPENLRFCLRFRTRRYIYSPQDPYFWQNFSPQSFFLPFKSLIYNTFERFA